MNTKNFDWIFIGALIIFFILSEFLVAGIWGAPGSEKREIMDCIDDIGHWDKATNRCIPANEN